MKQFRHSSSLRAWHFGAALVVVLALLVVATVVRDHIRVSAQASPVVEATPVSNDEISGDAPATSADEESPRHVPQELELLNQIRSQIGSPIDSSVFGDAGNGASRENAFDETYRRAATEAEPEDVSPPRSDWNVPADPESAYRSALRDAARVLDFAAADLEDADSYDRADALRNWATKLREDARAATPDAASGD